MYQSTIPAKPPPAFKNKRATASQDGAKRFCLSALRIPPHPDHHHHSDGCPRSASIRVAQDATALTARRIAHVVAYPWLVGDLQVGSREVGARADNPTRKREDSKMTGGWSGHPARLMNLSRRDSGH